MSITTLLEEAVNRISKLPEKEQDKIAKIIFDEIENEDATTVIRQQPIPRFIKEFDTRPMEKHLIRTNEDILYQFQKRIETFPWVNGKRIISEISATLIQCAGGPCGLNQMLFAETLLCAPWAQKSLKTFSARSYPQAFLMADSKKNTLYVKLMTYDPTIDHLTKEEGTIFTMDDIFFNDDIWKYFSPSARKYLEEIDLGFGPNKKPEEWAKLINNYPHSVPINYEINNIDMNLFPIKINGRGAVVTLGSVSDMKDPLINALLDNTFTINRIIFAMAFMHTHRKINNPEGLHKRLVDKYGDKYMQLSLSIFDVQLALLSESDFNLILSKHLGGRKKNTVQPYWSVIGLDDEGNAVDIRHYNLNRISDIPALRKALKRAREEIYKENPDISPFDDFLELINDPRVASNKLGEGVTKHLGDWNYRRGQEERLP